MTRYFSPSLLAVCGLFGMAEQAGAMAIGQSPAASPVSQGIQAGRMLAGTSLQQTGGCEAMGASVAVQTAPTLVMNAAFMQNASAPGPQLSKAAAILGGAASALERIRLEQAGQANAGRVAYSADIAAFRARADRAAAGGALIPGAGQAQMAVARTAPAIAGVSCSGFTIPHAAIAVAPGRTSPIAGSGDFLQTQRLSVSHTAFDRQWDRVSRQALSPAILRHDPSLSRFSQGHADLAAIEAVNAWTNRRIRYIDDAKLFGTPDYWAGAQKTLKLGAGDCEDIAITKMQLLAAMGVARSDMFLTIARDLARHADHALLVVRLGGQYLLLDNSTDRVLDARSSNDYQPVLSFSEGHKWLHGTVVAAN